MIHCPNVTDSETKHVGNLISVFQKEFSQFYINDVNCDKKKKKSWTKSFLEIYILYIFCLSFALFYFCSWYAIFCLLYYIFSRLFCVFTPRCFRFTCIFPSPRCRCGNVEKTFSDPLIKGEFSQGFTVSC